MTGTPLPGVTPLGTGDGHTGSLTVSSAILPNDCHVLTLGTGNTLTVNLPGAFVAGDAVVAMQVQDDLAAASGGAALATTGTAGAFEFARVSSVGATITLAAPLASSYRSTGNKHAQACRVPEYTDLTVTATGSLSASPWNGATGGIVAVLVKGTLSLSGSIGAVAAGFRGGQTPSVSTSSVPNVNDVAPSSGGGGKGEGIDGRAFGLGGRGEIANGAGGGNPFTAGGAGGGNAGPGGAGGLENVSAGPNPNTGGLGGLALPNNPIRLFFGGGGGAGALGFGDTVDGGAGGGAVVVVAHAIGGSSGKVDVSGAAGAPAAVDKVGGGGGGAGGTIVLVLESDVGFNGSFRASGGNGGDVTPDGAGPGGGGGGGRIIEGVKVAGATRVTPGGVSGTNGASTRGAASGSGGFTGP